MIARLVATVLLVLAPSIAQADWLFTPSFGTTFGADSFGRENPTYGAAIASVDAEAFGWEAELAFAPDFFAGNGDGVDFVDGGSVVSAMANALIGFPVGGAYDGRFRPYLTGGVGLMQMRVISDNGLFETNNQEVGFNAGGGLMAFLTDRVGLRGDVRYLRSFQNKAPSWTRRVDLDVAPGNFDFLRATVGLTFRLGQ